MNVKPTTIEIESTKQVEPIVVALVLSLSLNLLINDQHDQSHGLVKLP